MPRLSPGAPCQNAGHTSRCPWEAAMTRSRGPLTLALAGLLAATVIATTGARSAWAEPPSGQIIWGLPVSLPAAWLDPADATGILIPFMVYYALHDALAKPLPGNGMAPSLAESWNVSA